MVTPTTVAHLFILPLTGFKPQKPNIPLSFRPVFGVISRLCFAVRTQRRDSFIVPRENQTGQGVFEKTFSYPAAL
jgi:hypothetical protein